MSLSRSSAILGWLVASSVCTVTRQERRIDFANPTGYYTTTWNLDAAAATPKPVQDYSNDALLSLWDQVGPVTKLKHIPEVAKLEAIADGVADFAQPSHQTLHPLVTSNFPDLANVKLPSNFMWGLASSAYQIEGAAKEDGKGPSIWDLLSHRVPNFVKDNTTGDVSASHYYLYKQDLARVKALGIPALAISISWPRIFPFGSGPINQQGVRHYDDVIATMVRARTTPVITLFHWDTPLELFNAYGGWSNERIVEDFFQYAKFIIERYDSYVPIWFTINEPQYCDFQYKDYPAGRYYPAYNNITGGNAARFLCGHHSLLAHATVAKWYHEEFKGRGRITMKQSGNYFEPASQSPADLLGTQRQYDFTLGWFAGPWLDGDYPASLKATLNDTLPTLTAEQKAMIKGSCDFFAIDAYSSYVSGAIPDVEACVRDRHHSAYPECSYAKQTSARDGFGIGPASDPGTPWLKSTPVGLRAYLKKIKDLYPTVPDIQITEFGFAEPFESQFEQLSEITWDLRRADYYQGYLDNMLAAMHYEGINITGAWGWSIYDNFEWKLGEAVKFGVQYLNYSSLERTPKASMFQFLNWFR